MLWGGIVHYNFLAVEEFIPIYYRIKKMETLTENEKGSWYGKAPVTDLLLIMR